MPTFVERLLDHCDRHDPGELLSVSLHGSSTLGGLRQDSDIDLLLVTRQSLTEGEREELTALLLRFSGRRATQEPGRPADLTSVVLSSVTPWAYPPVSDYQYGEWLRDDFAGGLLPEPRSQPDLAIMLASARDCSTALRGQPLTALIQPIPASDVRRAIQDCVPALMDDLVGDERNVLLTLARMIVTLESGEIVPKDVAAQTVGTTSPTSVAEVLGLAREGYLGTTIDDWAGLDREARRAADELCARVREALAAAGTSDQPAGGPTGT